MTRNPNNLSLTSWMEVNDDSDFPIQNLPLAIGNLDGAEPTVVSAIGNNVVDLARLKDLGYFSGLGINPSVFRSYSLKRLIELGKSKTREIRCRLSEILDSNESRLKDNHAHRDQIIHPMGLVTLLRPVKFDDYTDFYSSEQHVKNVSDIFRGAPTPPEGWYSKPMGYDGRTSSIVVSGTDIHRPWGQIKPGDSRLFEPSRRVDFEIEMAFITYPGKPHGQIIRINETNNYIFGVVMLNDLSARDIQREEYIPLGPYLGKSFASPISPWVIMLDALEPFKVVGPKQTAEVFPYLQLPGSHNYDITLEAFIQPEHSVEQIVSVTNAQYLYWNFLQQLAHQSSNGCPIGIDLYGSGTISGPTPNSYGSLLELGWNGQRPIPMPDGTTRIFIENNDTVIFRGHAERNGVRIGFGELITKILPAINNNHSPL